MTRQSLPPPQGKRRAGEIAGGTAAECAVVCCCCPCAVVNILLLAIYKLPAGLCKKAIRRRKRQRLQKMKMKQQQSSSGNNNGKAILTLEQCLSEEMKAYTAEEGKSTEVDELEKEMWARFHETGFWRSFSRRQGT